MECRDLGGLPKPFLQPCLLLLLKEEPGYGYDLVARLRTMGLDDDSAAVYRALRALERQGEVTSYWSTSEAGPARRMYRLTREGDEALVASAAAVNETLHAIEAYLCRLALLHGRPAAVPRPANPLLRPAQAARRRNR